MPPLPSHQVWDFQPRPVPGAPPPSTPPGSASTCLPRRLPFTRFHSVSTLAAVLGKVAQVGSVVGSGVGSEVGFKSGSPCPNTVTAVCARGYCALRVTVADLCGWIHLGFTL